MRTSCSPFRPPLCTRHCSPSSASRSARWCAIRLPRSRQRWRGWASSSTRWSTWFHRSAGGCRWAPAKQSSGRPWMDCSHQRRASPCSLHTPSVCLSPRFALNGVEMPEPLPPERHELPAHPDRVDDADLPVADRRWGGIAVVVLLGALLVLIVVLHLTGIVGPGAH